MSFDDVSNLCKHVFVEQLKDKLPSEEKKCLDLIAYGQDILYVWNAVDGCVHSINVKHSVRDSDLGSQLILQPLKGILFSPERIFLNVSSSLLALVSASDEGSGITILELPVRWTTDTDKIRVPSKNLGESIFIGEQITLRQAKWHPASPSDSHLLVLTADECLRLYCTTSGEVLWKCYLTKNVKRTLPSKISIGDIPVDFDIGLPFQEESPSKIKWPILVLWGNGDVYCIESTIEDDRQVIPVSGPLRMFPSSDDNFGTDACSILILRTSPPIVAFSTSVGSVYNCILLSSEEVQGSHDKALYVVECIELEVGFTLGEEDDISPSPIILQKHPTEKSMYFAIHKAGIHSVTLPLVSKLYEFIESNETVFPPYRQKSFVEYLLCTGFNKSSSLDALPILGCTYIDVSSSLLVLLNSRDLVNIRITPHYLHSVQNLEVNINKAKEEDGFFLYIQTLLKENGPGPLVKLPESNPQDIYNIIYKMKMSYVKTMDTHELVSKKIKEKSQQLLLIFREQEKQAQAIAKEQNELYAEALKISERYMALNTTQMSLMCRVENILQNYCSDFKLSERERNAVDFLTNVQKKIAVYSKEINRIQLANRYQGNMVAERSETMTRRGIDMSDIRGRTLRKELHNLTSEIAHLMKRVKSIEESVPDLIFRS